MEDNFARAQEEFENREPQEEPDAVTAYRNTLGLGQQAIVAREYLDSVGGLGLYKDWLDGRGLQDTNINITEYVESLGSFYDWLQA